MNKFNAILLDSLLEIRSRKIIYIYAAVTLFLILLFAFIPSMQIQGEDLFESEFMSSELFSKILAHFFDGFIGFFIFLLVFGTAFLLPSYLGKGRIELTLSKPISRWKLLTMKFVAVYLIHMFILILMSLLLWLTISFRLGQFSWGILPGIMFSFVHFLFIYLFVFVIGALTRSGALAIMGYFIIRFAANLLESREVAYQFIGESVWTSILDWMYYIFPKFGEVGGNFMSLMRGDGFVNFFSIYTTLIFCAVIYALTLYIFSRRDY